MYYDSEHDKYITREELLTEYTGLKACGEAEAGTFAEYVSNCMTYNGGTLELVKCTSALDA